MFQETLKNVSLVNEQAAQAAVPKKTVVDVDKHERPIFTGIIIIYDCSIDN